MTNVITAFRILFSLCLLFTMPLSYPFFAFYLLCGISDVLDGFIARITGAESEFGAKLDSVADLTFVAASLYKLLPVLVVPKGLLIWTCLIAVIKVINIISGFVVRHKFVAVHSVLNKVTGMSLFILPLSLSLVEIKYSGYAVCAVATIAAIQEGHIIRTGIERR